MMNYPKEAAIDLIVENLTDVRAKTTEDCRTRTAATAALLDEVLTTFKACGLRTAKMAPNFRIENGAWLVFGGSWRFALSMNDYGELLFEAHDTTQSAPPAVPAWEIHQLTWNAATNTWLGGFVYRNDDTPMRRLGVDGAPFVRRSAIEDVVAIAVRAFDLLPRG